MQYVLRPEELADLLSNTKPARCQAWIDAWWAARDPIPTDGTNQARDEHERRVLEAQAHFGRGKWPGWDDRGEVLIRYGEPASRMQSGADVVPPGVRARPRRCGITAVQRLRAKLRHRHLRFRAVPGDCSCR
jgi:GWxTD domain-containing protein